MTFIRHTDISAHDNETLYEFINDNLLLVVLLTLATLKEHYKIAKKKREVMK